MSPAAGSRAPLVVASVVVATVVTLDQLTKTWAVRALTDGPIEVVGDTVTFTLSFNPGAAFSIFTSHAPVLAVLAGAITGALVWVLARTRSVGMALGLALVLGGALGNLADRIFRAPRFLHGEVVDFVSVGTFPTFNVADAAITVGAILVVWFALRGELEPHRT